MILAQVAATLKPCGITSVMRGIASHWGSPGAIGALAGPALPGDRVFEGWRFRRKSLAWVPSLATLEMVSWLKATGAGALLLHYPPLDRPAISAARTVGIKTAYYYHNVTDPLLYEGDERSRREAEDAHMLRILSHVDKVFCNSVYTALKVKEKTGIDAVIAPPSVDTRAFHPAQRKDEGVFRIVHVGRVVPHKGLRELLMLVRHLLDRYMACEFHHVGMIGEDGYGRECQKLFEHPRMRWWEHLPDAKMVAVLQKAHAFASASRFEGFGMPFLEAAACGLPSVGYDVAAIPEAVIEGETGRLVPECDTAAMEAVLEGWIRDPAEAARLGVKARAHAELCTWEKTVATIQNAWCCPDVGAQPVAPSIAVVPR